MTIGTRSPGDFCWINMLTPRPSEACDFFAAVLGWTYGEIPGMGYTVKVAGRDIGGLFDLDGPNTPPGTRAHIGVMVKVDDADRTVTRATALGGSAQPPFDIGGRLRMAVCKDPSGVAVDVFEPKTARGTEVDDRLHGAPCWFEYITTDGAPAAAFYSGLFGWTAVTAVSAGAPDGTYTTFALAGRPIAGLLPVTPEMTALAPRWAVYFTVEDANAAVDTALRLGGELSMPLRSVPGVGRIGTLHSPQGVLFDVVQHGD